MPVTYESARPIGLASCNVDFYNPVLHVENYWGQKEVYDGYLSWGNVTFAHSLDEDTKKLLGLYDAGDALSNKKLDKRVAKIAKRVEHKIGVKFSRVYGDLRPHMASSESLRSLSNRAIVYRTCCAYMRIPF